VSGAIDRRGLVVLGVGHACSDLCQGAVPALLPFFVHQRGYNYAAASALVLAMAVSSSIVQPVFGHLADRRSLPALMPVGLLVGGVGIALAGVMPSYPATFAAVALSGLGVAAFHPEAARYANYVSGTRAASGMSVFSVGGNAGFALGPILVTPLVLGLGLTGTIWLVMLPAIVGVLLVRELPRLRSFRPTSAPDDAVEPVAPDRWAPFARLAGVAAARSGVYFGLQAFVAVYFIQHVGTSTAAGNAALTVLVVAGAVGTLVGGRLADRVGRRAILVGCMAVLPALILLLVVAGRDCGFLLLALIGFFCVGNFSITVVLGQEYLPNRIGIASGVTLGAAIGAGGLVAALLGVLADHAGLTTVLLVIAALPMPALLLAISLPRENTARPAANPVRELRPGLIKPGTR
jgi:MFS transporter, FSR family, fosmidomycin resistance protein